MKYKMKNKAFTMIELSIFILILSLIAVAALIVRNSDNDVKAVAVTKDRMEKINQALGKYAAEKSVLPCPARLTMIKSSDIEYGNAANASGTGTCATPSGVLAVGGQAIYYGAVPFKALGIGAEMAEDGFGSKIVYVVKGQFVTSGRDYFNNNTITTPKITVQRRNANGTYTMINDNAMFLLISGGKNKKGMFNANSSSANSSSSAADGEIKNISTSSDTNFTSLSTEADFDDIVFHQARDQFLSRSEDINTTKKCPPSSLALYGTTMNWAEAHPGQIVAATTPCPSSCTGSPSIRWNAGVFAPTRKCLSNGTWESTVINACTSTSCSPCSPTNESLYGYGADAVTVSWPSTARGTIATSTTPCPSSCNSVGVAWNAGATYPTKMCNSDGTWGSIQTNCSSRPCCRVTNGTVYGNATYSGSTTTLSLNETANLGNCISGHGRAIKNWPDTVGGTIGGTSCDRAQNNLINYDRITSAPYVTCLSGGYDNWSGTYTAGVLSVTNNCSACRSCTTSSGILAISATDILAYDACASYHPGVLDRFRQAYNDFAFTSGDKANVGHGTYTGSTRCAYTYNRHSTNNCNGTRNCDYCRYSSARARLRCLDGDFVAVVQSTASTDCNGVADTNSSGGGPCKNRTAVPSGVASSNYVDRETTSYGNCSGGIAYP